MAGGTHSFDMIKRLRDNENLRKKKYFKTKASYNRAAQELNVDLKTATDQERGKLRRKIIEEQRADFKRTVKLLILSIALTAILVLLLIEFVLP